MNPRLILPKNHYAGHGRMESPSASQPFSTEEKLGYDDDMEEESPRTQDIGCARLCSPGRG